MEYSPQSWTLREKIGQLIIVRASGFLYDHQIRYPQWEPSNDQLRGWLETLNLGGVILLGGSAVELSQRTQQLQAWSPQPLFLAADIEEGVGQRFSGATWFPPPMALAAIAREDLELAQVLAEKMGYWTALEAVALGLNWVLAPIADVNNNPDNPVINVRAFGDKPEVVSALVRAFIAGANKLPVLTTAKHFPGHGDTSTDSHLHLPIITQALERLETLELIPFQTAIAAGVDSVMTAHIRVPIWDAHNPATLSPAILTGQLREKLGFNGLIVTDALIMGGVTQAAPPEEVVVRALLAGADCLLMPLDPIATIDAIEIAVQSGRLSPARLDQSLARIQLAKHKLKRDADSLSLVDIASSSAKACVADILSHSGQKGGNLPLIPLESAAVTNLVIVDDLLTCDFLDRACPAVKVPQSLGYRLLLLDQAGLEQLQCPTTPVVLQVFVRGNPFRGLAGLTDSAQKIYSSLLQSGQVQALILYGSPYVLEWFLPQFDPVLPWVFSYGQMPQSQAIAWDTLLAKPFLETTQDQVFI